MREKRSPHNQKFSNEVSKVSALDSINQDLILEGTGEAIDDEFATVVTNLLTKGMQNERLQNLLDKMARAKNCEALTKIKVNQIVWNNLSSNIRSRDLCMQILSCLSDIPGGKDVIRLLSDSVLLLANTNNEL